MGRDYHSCGTIIEKRQGQRRYYYYSISHRVKIDPAASGKTRGSGKSRVVADRVYLGTAESILRKCAGGETRDSAEPCRVVPFGLAAALLEVARGAGFSVCPEGSCILERGGADRSWCAFMEEIAAIVRDMSGTAARDVGPMPSGCGLAPVAMRMSDSELSGETPAARGKPRKSKSGNPSVAESDSSGVSTLRASRAAAAPDSPRQSLCHLPLHELLWRREISLRSPHADHEGSRLAALAFEDTAFAVAEVSWNSPSPPWQPALACGGGQAPPGSRVPDESPRTHAARECRNHRAAVVPKDLRAHLISLIEEKARGAGVSMPPRVLMEELNDISLLVPLFQQTEEMPRLSRLTPVQKHLFEIFGLDRHVPRMNCST